jgi:hypothetical protein
MEIFILEKLNKNIYVKDYQNINPIKDCMSREILKNGDYRMELIEETDDDTRERYWILNTDCINK